MAIKRVIYGIVLVAGLVSALSSCGKNPQEEAALPRELTVLFSPHSGLVGDAYNELILQGVMEAMAAHSEAEVHLLKPESLSEARSRFNTWKASATAHSALILCGPEYEQLLPGVALSEGRILLLDSKEEYGGGISTALLKRYGGAWLSGALMKDFHLQLIKALNGDRIIDTIAQGVQDGYIGSGGEDYNEYVLSAGYEGMNMADELFHVIYMREGISLSSPSEGILFPVCGASRLGAFSYSQNSYYPVAGCGEDCSVYSDCLPFSLMLDVGTLVQEYIGLWMQDAPWPSHAEFGLQTGHVGIRFNERFYEGMLGTWAEWPITLSEWEALEAGYKEQALEKEASHAY